MSQTNKTAMIELNNIFKVYNMGSNDVPALDGVDFLMNRGEFVSIIGQSGSGKSTMLHLLGCLDSPTSGKYELEGNDISDLPDKELSRIRNKHFGFIFQAYNLLSDMTALENVEQPLIYAKASAKERRDKAKAMLEKVGLGDRLTHMPSQLSGGQQQRVAIARALVNDPTLLLADEPTGNLNTEAGDAVLDILQNLHSEGMSIVMVTHDLRIAGTAKRQVTLRDGKVFSDSASSQKSEHRSQ
jgi:putative ABC transport system ATP-binding protein